MSSSSFPAAPEWAADEWLNTPQPLTLQALRGHVVVLLAFQMLCPGCVARALPQAMRVHATFPREQVAMVGLHTVFEHHDAMTPTALRAFAHEYRIAFPLGIDRARPGQAVPETMHAYAMRGTPTWLLYDREGRCRAQHFGEVDDLRLGAQIATLLAEPAASLQTAAAPASTAPSCADGACTLPADD